MGCGLGFRPDARYDSKLSSMVRSLVTRPLVASAVGGWLALLVLGACSLLAPDRDTFEGGERGDSGDAGDESDVDVRDATSDSPPVDGGVIVFDGPGTVKAVAVTTDGEVFFTLAESGRASVQRWRDGTVTPLLEGLGDPSSLDLDNQNVYVGDARLDGGVHRVSRTTTTDHVSIPATSPHAVTLGGGRVHWISGNAIFSTGAQLTVAGSAIVTRPSAPTALAFLQPGRLFWLDQGGTLGLWEVADGGTDRALFTGQNAPLGLTARDTFLFFTRNTGTDNVFRANADGSGTPEGIGRFAKGAIAAGEADVYWSTGEGVVHGPATPPKGSVATRLLDRRGCDNALAASGAFVVAGCNDGERAVVLRIAQ